jgi:pimeloyl-ACP methyl ester carboxylesterase
MAAVARRRFDPVAETFGIAEGLARFPLYAWELAILPRGKGAPVMVLPGFMAGDGSTFMLRSFLSSLGYRTHTWGLGRNRGDVVGSVRETAPKVRQIAERSGQPVRIVGWSLGGVVAREVARREPDAVHSVITLGTPVVGGPKYTAVASMYEASGQDLDELERRIARINKQPIRVPVTAIYTRSDQIVDWQACIDRDNEHVEHIEVRTSHSGLGFSPEVFRIVARKLAP